jgi:adenosylcobinamide-GDP ribazoletransferase
MSIKDCLKGVVLNIQFLTRIPIPAKITWDDRAFAAGAAFAPVVGLLVGLFSVGAYYIFSLTGSRPLSIFMGMAMAITISGGLHLDGLADTFDAIFSYRDRDRALAIMKDSRLGTSGAIVLFLVIMLKYILLSSLSENIIATCFVVMPVISRMTIPWCAGLSPYARKGEKSIAAGLVEHTGLLEAVIASILAALIGSLFLLFAVIPLVLIVIAFTLMVIMYMKNRLGGITGDVIGAVIELSELLFLISILILGKIYTLQHAVII